MTLEKLKPKQLLRPMTTGAGSAMNQSQFLAITCNSLEAREKSRVHGAIGFGFDSHWLKNWRESFKPITKRSNCNHVITFDSHLKTALTKTRWDEDDNDNDDNDRDLANEALIPIMPAVLWDISKTNKLKIRQLNTQKKTWNHAFVLILTLLKMAYR